MHVNAQFIKNDTLQNSRQFCRPRGADNQLFIKSYEKAVAFFQKIILHIFAYAIFLLYLCSEFVFNAENTQPCFVFNSESTNLDFMPDVKSTK